MNKLNLLLSILIAGLSFTAGYLMDKPKEHSKYDYEIETTQDRYYIYSDGRFVGCQYWNDRNNFDSLILSDNQ